MAKRMSMEEKQAARAAEHEVYRAKRLAEFRSGFDKRYSRKLYTEETVWKASAAGSQDPDSRVASALWEMVRKYKDLRDSMRSDLKRLVETASDALVKLANGDDPFWASNGICVRHFEVDQAGHQLKIQADAVARVAWIGGWRVREIEPGYSRDKNDLAESLRVVQTGSDWNIRKWVTGPDNNPVSWRDATPETRCVWFDTNRAEFVESTSEGSGYATEDLAWHAVAAILGESIS